MITVSDEFIAAVGAPERRTVAKICFEILDIYAYSNASATVTGEAEISNKAQLYDKKREMSGKYATLEEDFFKLDGSFRFPPAVGSTGYELGWWSSDLCNSDGLFSVPQVITTQFTVDHSSAGLTITFDEFTGEHAADFTIKFYDSSNTLIYSEIITGNVNSVYLLEHTVSNYRKIVLAISKWGTRYRRARITEIDFGVIKIYTDDQIIDMTVLEELDTISNTLSSNELNITLDNYDKTFNILNPTGIYQSLQRNQVLSSYIGVEKATGDIEYVPMGVYYLIDWQSDKGTLTATFTARDVLNFMSQSDFTGGTYINQTLYSIAVAILMSAGISNYSLDIALQSISVSGTIDKMDHRSALQIVVIAGMCIVYSDRYGKLIIKQLGNTVSGQTISKDNMYSTPQITLDSLLNTVIIDNMTTSYTYVDPAKPANEQTLSVTISNTLITNETHAQNVSAWVLSEYKKRYLYEIPWRQNPALECCDIVTVEDEYGQNYNVRITKNEFDYAGYLKGKTNGKGGGI